MNIPRNAYVVTLIYGSENGLIHTGTVFATGEADAVSRVSDTFMRVNGLPEQPLSGVSCILLPPEFLCAALSLRESDGAGPRVISLVPAAEPQDTPPENAA